MNILGCPVKISSQRTIYFPVTYLHYYRINAYDQLVRQQYEHYFLFRPYCEQPLMEDEVLVRLHAGNTHLPDKWLIDNQLKPGKDYLYLIGIDDGFVVSASAKITL